MTGKSQALHIALLFIIVVLCTDMHCKPKQNRSRNVTVPEFEPFKEFHFHTYFDPENPEEVAHARDLRNEILSNLVLKKIIAIPYGYYYDPENPVLEHNDDAKGLSLKPVGPHPSGQFQTWVPVEYFDEMYAWFLQKRSNLTIFVHPLTEHVLADHTIRVVFMGKSYNLKSDILPEYVPRHGSRYDYLGLGYAKPN